MPPETYSEGPLTIEVDDRNDAVIVCMTGRSDAARPSTFILPILSRALELGTRAHKPTIIDVSRLSYLNSSTFTLIIRILEQAKRGAGHLTIRYNASPRGQSVAFSALHLFSTSDGRISIETG